MTHLFDGDFCIEATEILLENLKLSVMEMKDWGGFCSKCARISSARLPVAAPLGVREGWKSLRNAALLTLRRERTEIAIAHFLFSSASAGASFFCCELLNSCTIPSCTKGSPAKTEGEKKKPGGIIFLSDTYF